MEKNFYKRELKLSEGLNKPLPPSLPLVLSGQFDYDPHTHSLIKKDESANATTGLHIVDTSLKLLRTIEKPVAVLAICGPYRTGKSYFLSRFLGRTESFKLGHSMSMCTRGIWMATSTLECDDFAVVLLDTEGINSAGSGSHADSTHVTNLLIVTVLLSSTLIYNSRNVPRGSDVKRLSSFVHLSKCVMESETTENQQSKQLYQRIHLPHFVWLLRDVDTIPTNHNGECIPLTEYIVQLLKSIQSSSSQSLANKVSTALFDLFPTIQCKKLSPPSTDQKVLADIINNTDSLRSEFSQELEEVTSNILQGLKPKHGYNTTTLVDGFVLASMLEQYVVSLNKPGEFPVLDNTWRTAVQLKLEHFAEQLLEEYEQEMEARVCPRFPVEEGLNGETGDTLLNAHLEIFAKKRLSLQKEIIKYQAPSNEEKTDAESTLLSIFDQKIVQYHQTNHANRVVGGKLLSFVQLNYNKSHDFCTVLYTREYQAVETVTNTALHTGDPVDISNELEQFKEVYWKSAIGPAKKDVYDQKRIESSRIEIGVKNIPGKPENLKVEGCFSDRVKIHWDPPSINSHAVKHYEVFVKPKGQKIYLAAKRLGCSAVISDLQNSTFHLFSVRAVSSTCTGKFGPVVCTVTDISKTAFALTCATVLILSCGFHVVHILSSLPDMYEAMAHVRNDEENSDIRDGAAEEQLQQLEQQLQKNIDENYSEYRRECALPTEFESSNDD